jgi:drug/metabolite transporter (DMT)-like permease
VLILYQFLFGSGSVVGKLGVGSFNPVWFAFLRAAIATPPLVAMARCGRPSRDDVAGARALLGDSPLFALSGLFLSCSQLFFIVGDKLSSPLIGSAWQPSQPIMVMVLAVALGWERASVRKVAGLLCALVGGAWMIIYGHSVKGNAEGHMFFALNCLGTACFVVLGKVLLERWSASTVVGASYVFATVYLLVAQIVVAGSDEAQEFLCPARVPQANADAPAPGRAPARAPSCGAWEVPSGSVVPLLYWSLVLSFACDLMMTWCNKHIAASHVLMYTSVQPIASALTVVLVNALDDRSRLEGPGRSMLGCLGVFLGLALVSLDGEGPAPAGLRSRVSAACWGCAGAGARPCAEELSDPADLDVAFASLEGGRRNRDTSNGTEDSHQIIQ